MSLQANKGKAVLAAGGNRSCRKANQKEMLKKRHAGRPDLISIMEYQIYPVKLPTKYLLQYVLQ